MPITSDQFKAHVDIHGNIVKAVSNYFEERGFSVYPSKQLGDVFADIIAVRDHNLVVAIEAKTEDFSELRKGIGQALSYMSWTHKAYLAIPLEQVNLCQELLQYTPIGIIGVEKDQLFIAKEAELKEPDRTKLYQLLHGTVGFCWLCGRTFNIIPPASPDFQEYQDTESIYVGHRDIEPELFKKLEQIKGKKIQTVGAWVGICKICSRLLGQAIYEFLELIIEKNKVDWFSFDFWPTEELVNELREKMIQLLK